MKKTFTLLLLLVTITTNLFAQDTRANAREADITIVLKEGKLAQGDLGAFTPTFLKAIPLSVIGIEGDASKLLGNAKTVALIFDVERKDPSAIKSVAVGDGTPTALGIYDLQGRRVALPQQGSQLPKGIYVVNGHKVVVK